MKRSALLALSPCLLAPVATAQWSLTTAAAGVNTATSVEGGPSPTFDGLTLYFSSDRPGLGLYDIYRATRAAPYAAFGAPTLIPELSSTSYEGQPCARIDDCEIFFFSNRPGGSGGYDLWRADRPSTSVPFNAPVNVAELNSLSSELAPSLSLDGLRIYFDTRRGVGSAEIYTATRPSLGSPFGTPTPVVELNTPSDDRDPHISADGLVIFFASDRVLGPGLNDIWMASRLDLASPFGNLTNVTSLNTTSSDQEPSFGIFHDEIFFSSLRTGNWDVYSARFTGLIGVGIAGPGSSRELRFSDPASPGLVYLAASSLGTSPGIPIDTRRLPLNFDLLFQLSLGGLPPILTGYVGALDTDGIAAGRISFTGFAHLVGLRFATAFLVFDPAAPSGIKTISNADEVLVQ